MRRFPTSSMNFAAIALATTLLSGCAGSPAPKESANKPRPADGWSSKEESTLEMMPDRPEFDLGPAFEVVADESNAEQAAIQILRKAVDSTNPLLRMNAIEGIKRDPIQVSAAVQKGLGDDNRAVRFVSTMIVGELKLTEFRALVEPLLMDETESVRAAAIYAIRRCGGKPDLNPLSSMLLGDNAEVKGNAALVLGEIGDPSAISLLRFALDRGVLKSNSARRRIVELQIAEAMVKLGDAQQREVIRAALFSRPEEGELLALACQICGEVKDEDSLPNLLDLATRPGQAQQSAEVRLAAAAAASRINPRRAVLFVPESYVSSTRFELRAQAASTLGASKQRAALPTLIRLMNDPNPLVQVSAAAAVLEIGSSSN